MIMKVAAIQTNVKSSKDENFRCLERKLLQLENEEIDCVVLPEMFICPYQTHLFEEYSEEEGGESWLRMSQIAKNNKVYLVAGSVPELADGHIYNTSYVFDRNGHQIAKHRKMHLFDIDVKNGQQFKESDTLSPGNSISVFRTEFGVIGLCVCYDFRFPEISRLMVDLGAKMIIVPAAFNMTTGPSHWDMLFRTRALDNQVYTLGVAPARNLSSGYTSWGHSILVSPWGSVMEQLTESESMMIVDVDLDYVDEIRRELPLLKHRRLDLYQVGNPDRRV